MTGMNMDIDMSPITSYTEFAEVFSQALTSNESRANMTKAIGIGTAAQFNIFADDQAMMRPRNLWHVYEMQMLGDPDGRLWRTILTGAQSDKTLSFSWKAARKVNPVGERSPNPVSGETPDTRRSVHVFVWRAPILEEGREITVNPSEDKQILAFPAGGEMRFSRLPITFETTRDTQGQFESIWDTFWTQMVDRVVEEDWTLPTENAINKDIPYALLQIQSTKKRVPIGFRVNLEPKTNAASLARGIVAKLNGSYLKQARQREAISGGDESDL